MLRLHRKSGRGLEPYFRDRQPLPVGSIKLDADPLALAHLAPGSAAGLRGGLDRDGKPVEREFGHLLPEPH